MSTKKTDSVAYLFKEMDPSEKVEFERLLSKNENLLIEVESLRNIHNSVRKLPDISAPEELLDSVCAQAEQASRSRGNRKKPLYFAVAALVSIGFTAGAIIMDHSSESASETGAASIGAVGASGGLTHPEPPVEVPSNDLTPWVDQNEILHFTGNTASAETNRTDSLLQNSYQRLKPVNDPSQSRIYQRELHLTGSRQ